MTSRLSVRDSYLRSLPPDARAAVITDMVRAAREPATEADVARVDAELAEYEREHGMTTEAMRRGGQRGLVSGDPFGLPVAHAGESEGSSRQVPEREQGRTAMIKISGHSDDIVSLEGCIDDEIECCSARVRVKIGSPEASPGHDAAGVMVTMAYGGTDSGAVWAATIEPFDDGVPVPWAVSVEFKAYSPVVRVGCPEGTPIVAERSYGGGAWETRLVKP